ncbi:hypothetical protein [Actinoplanes xinjiangensis]|uniref:hypothetical protein n=1 Tax=Actinoplanes xinjiangensis TaxID=512350 RepID=UPI0034225563
MPLDCGGINHVRDQLKEMADGEGLTLSEYVRKLLLAAVVPVYTPEVKHGDEPAPESMRTIDRQVLSLLQCILARVLPEDANGEDGDLKYQLERAMILEEGFCGTIAGRNSSRRSSGTTRATRTR